LLRSELATVSIAIVLRFFVDRGLAVFEVDGFSGGQPAALGALSDRSCSFSAHFPTSAIAYLALKRESLIFSIHSTGSDWPYHIANAATDPDFHRLPARALLQTFNVL
jgi:hypothetical protein